MKHAAIILSLVLGVSSAAWAQGDPSGRGSIKGDPAASSASPGAAPPHTTGQSSPSGSGTSTSGGRDNNNDQGRDKMPDSSMTVDPKANENKR
jgi:hypothetical protein